MDHGDAPKSKAKIIEKESSLMRHMECHMMRPRTMMRARYASTIVPAVTSGVTCQAAPWHAAIHSMLNTHVPHRKLKTYGPPDERI